MGDEKQHLYCDVLGNPVPLAKVRVFSKYIPTSLAFYPYYLLDRWPLGRIRYYLIIERILQKEIASAEP
jgi:hypothetical protein